MPLVSNPDADRPHPCLYEHTGHDFGDDVAKVLHGDPRKAIYQKVPWYAAVVVGRWKYVRYLQPGVTEEVYDLAADPDERKNLIGDAAHAGRLATMREALEAELKRTAAPAQMLAKGKP